MGTSFSKTKKTEEEVSADNIGTLNLLMAMTTGKKSNIAEILPAIFDCLETAMGQVKTASQELKTEARILQGKCETLLSCLRKHIDKVGSEYKALAHLQKRWREQRLPEVEVIENTESFLFGVKATEKTSLMVGVILPETEDFLELLSEVLEGLRKLQVSIQEEGLDSSTTTNCWMFFFGIVGLVIGIIVTLAPPVAGACVPGLAICAPEIASVFYGGGAALCCASLTLAGYSYYANQQLKQADKYLKDTVENIKLCLSELRKPIKSYHEAAKILKRVSEHGSLDLGDVDTMVKSFDEFEKAYMKIIKADLKPGSSILTYGLCVAAGGVAGGVAVKAFTDKK